MTSKIRWYLTLISLVCVTYIMFIVQRIISIQNIEAVKTGHSKVERDNSVEVEQDHEDFKEGMEHLDPEIEQAQLAVEQAHSAIEQAKLAAGQAHPAAEQARPASEQAHPATEQAHPAAAQIEEANKLSNLTIILTESRHGSTWLMEVLGHPANVMHFFEPLFDRMSDRFRSHYPELSEATVLRKWRAIKLAQICMCDMSLGRDAGGMAGYQRNYDGNMSNRFIMEDCKFNRTTRLAKTISMYDITELKLLPELGCSNFKVIHLIRDPRAVLVSRMRTFHELYDGTKVLGPRIEGPMENFSDEYVRTAARVMCGHHMANMDHATEPWISGRYERVLYEHIAQDPIGVSRKLFAFLGQPFTEDDASYVYESSHGSQQGGGYKTDKDSSHVVKEWQGRILHRHLQVIEETCREVFVKLGYNFGID